MIQPNLNTQLSLRERVKERNTEREKVRKKESPRYQKQRGSKTRALSGQADVTVAQGNIGTRCRLYYLEAGRFNLRLGQRCGHGSREMGTRKTVHLVRKATMKLVMFQTYMWGKLKTKKSLSQKIKILNLYQAQLQSLNIHSLYGTGIQSQEINLKKKNGSKSLEPLNCLIETNAKVLCRNLNNPGCLEFLWSMMEMQLYLKINS